MIHRIKDFSIVIETEVDVFLEFSCFLSDVVNAGNLISGSSAFSKPSLNIFKFSVHICWSLACRILSITLLAWEMSVTLQWLAHSSVLPFLGIRARTDLFQSCGHCWVSQICWHIWAQHFDVCVHVLSRVWLFSVPGTTRLLCPWNFPGKNTGMGCHFLLQGIFQTQKSNLCLLCLLHWWVCSLPLRDLRSTWIALSFRILNTSAGIHHLR